MTSPSTAAASRTWTSHVTYSPNSHATPAVDTKRNLIVTNGSSHGLQVYDPANPKALPIRVASTSPKNIENASFPGFAYDSANDPFVGWSGASALYTLKAPAAPKTRTWVWSQLALDSGSTVTPTAPAGVRISGYVIDTFSRFRYVPSQKGVIVVNSPDESIYFFKLAAAARASANDQPRRQLHQRRRPRRQHAHLVDHECCIVQRLGRLERCQGHLGFRVTRPAFRQQHVRAHLRLRRRHDGKLLGDCQRRPDPDTHRRIECQPQRAPNTVATESSIKETLHGEDLSGVVRQAGQEAHAANGSVRNQADGRSPTKHGQHQK